VGAIERTCFCGGERSNSIEKRTAGLKGSLVKNANRVVCRSGSFMQTNVIMKAAMRCYFLVLYIIRKKLYFCFIILNLKSGICIFDLLLFLLFF
jgi:hypothetical protein